MSVRRALDGSVGSGNQPPPIVVGDVVVAAGGDPGDYVALDARSGEVVWRYSTDGAPTMAPLIAVADGIFAGDTRGVVRRFVLTAQARDGACAYKVFRESPTFCAAHAVGRRP